MHKTLTLIKSHAVTAQISTEHYFSALCWNAYNCVAVGHGNVSVCN